MKAVIILPTYNERENVTVLLDALASEAKKIRNHRIAYLVVDDTSPDGTKDVVEAYAKTHANVTLVSGPKEGLGKALLRGMTYAVEKMDAEIIVQMDADLSHDPTRLPLFLEAIDRGADIAIGCRYIPGGSIPENWGLHRKIFSIAANTIVRFGLGHPGVHDWTGGYRAFRKSYFEKLKTEMVQHSGYVFQIAFLYKSILLGAKIAEVPFHFTDRKYGRSKIVPSEYIRKVLVFVAVNRFHELATGQFGKFAVVGGIGFVINTLGIVGLVRLGFDPSVGSALGAEAAIISNFILNNAWTFKSRKATGFKALGKFLQFNLTSVGAILIQSGTVFAGTRIFGKGMYFPFYILGVAIGLVWNYFMYSRVIWKKSA